MTNDAVTRNSLKDFEEWLSTSAEKVEDDVRLDANEIKEKINSYPSVVQFVRPKGKWIWSFYSEGNYDIYDCSVCNNDVQMNKPYKDSVKIRYPFCPKCGADMSETEC